MKFPAILALAAIAPATIQAEAENAQISTSTDVDITTVTVAVPTIVYVTVNPGESPVPSNQSESAQTWSDTACGFETLHLTSTTTTTITSVITPPVINTTNEVTSSLANASQWTVETSSLSSIPVTTITVYPLPQTPEETSLATGSSLSANHTCTITVTSSAAAGMNFSASAYSDGSRLPIRSTLTSTLKEPQGSSSSNINGSISESGHATETATGSTPTMSVFEGTAAGRLRPNWTLQLLAKMLAFGSLGQAYSVKAPINPEDVPDLGAVPSSAGQQTTTTLYLTYVTTSTIKMGFATASPFLGIPSSSVVTILAVPSQNESQSSTGTYAAWWSATLNSTIASEIIVTPPNESDVLTSTSFAFVNSTNSVISTSTNLVNSTGQVSSTSFPNLTQTVSPLPSTAFGGPHLSTSPTTTETATATATGAASKVESLFYALSLPSFSTIMLIVAIIHIDLLV